MSAKCSHAPAASVVRLRPSFFNGTTDCAAHPPLAHLLLIPQTIDNDIGLIDKSFGFDTAVEQALVPLTCAHTEALAAKNGALFSGCLCDSKPVMGAAVLTPLTPGPAPPLTRPVCRRGVGQTDGPPVWLYRPVRVAGIARRE